MTAFQNLPQEILATIVGHVCDSRRHQDHFDLTDHKDLSNLRLTCRSLCRVTTPRLFENVVLDETFLESNHVNALLNFALRYPHIAWHARRLQRRLTPCVYRCLSTPILQWLADPSAETSSATQAGQGPKATTNAHKRRLIDILSQPIQALCDENPGHLIVDYDGVKKCCLTTQKKQRALKATLQAFPNLHYIECVPSDACSNYMVQASREFNKQAQCHTYNNILSTHFRLDAQRAIDHDTKFHLGQYMHPKITGLRLSQALNVLQPSWSQNLLHLKYLDLECSGTGSSGFLRSSGLYARRWNDGLARLQSLRTLTLRAVGDVSHLRSDDLYVDDMLLSCQFPQLTSMTLTNWARQRSRFGSSDPAELKELAVAAS